MSVTATIISILVIVSLIFGIVCSARLKQHLRRQQLEESRFTLLFHFIHIRGAVFIYLISLFVYSFFIFWIMYSFEL